MTQWQQISKHISQTLNSPFEIHHKNSVGGGSINSSYQITGTNGQHYFIKLNSSELEYMFQVEFDSLHELSKALTGDREIITQTIKIPQPICFGSIGSKSYLVIEYLSIKSSGDSKKFGQALAQMHKITAQKYGWYQNNIIGSTAQSNRQHNDWLTFWREERMRPQFQMLYDKGYQSYLQPLSEQLLNHIDSLLANHTPAASLLHGDLWSGNYAFTNTSEKQECAVIFDPALYYGDRETDLAMTELFGGFSQDFYQGYNDTWPLENGYNKRKALYNLYHILNHANLFGASYLNQAISMMQRLCK